MEVADCLDVGRESAGVEGFFNGASDVRVGAGVALASVFGTLVAELDAFFPAPGGSEVDFVSTDSFFTTPDVRRTALLSSFIRTSAGVFFVLGISELLAFDFFSFTSVDITPLFGSSFAVVEEEGAEPDLALGEVLGDFTFEAPPVPTVFLCLTFSQTASLSGIFKSPNTTRAALNILVRSGSVSFHS